MKTILTTSAMLIGALLLPGAGYTAGYSDADRSAPKASSDRSSPKAVVKDSVITAKIKAEMAKDRQVSAMNIKVDTNNSGVVTLSGKARSRDEADKAVLIARSVEGVASVENRIEIVPGG
jgi:hyperosmotically inducible periplasmic protein